jgi:hypothetical protein
VNSECREEHPRVVSVARKQRAVTILFMVLYLTLMVVLVALGLVPTLEKEILHETPLMRQGLAIYSVIFFCNDV